MEAYQLVEPLIKKKEMMRMNRLNIPLNYMYPQDLTWKSSRDTQEQKIFTVNIPLMNSLGTSRVNGIHRIVIDQILQGPSIY